MIQDDRNLCFLLIVVGRSDGIMQSFFRGGGGLAKVPLFYCEFDLSGIYYILRMNNLIQFYFFVSFFIGSIPLG